MQSLEKRNCSRQLLQIPLHFHSIEMAPTDPAIASETCNISRTGLFMSSPLRLKINEQVSLILRVPTSLSGSAYSDIRCSGRVVHERRFPNGDLGYGIHFDGIPNFKRPEHLTAAPSSA